jgi:hypothetical protein
MDSDCLKRTILENAAEIVRLHFGVHKTFEVRGRDKDSVEKWKRACAEFRPIRCAGFSGGYDGALDRIISGDPEAIEAAICFLECRPYFFRSG